MRKKMIVLLVCFFAVLVTQVADAQTRIRGGSVVLAEDGSPAIGATVVIKGTQMGVVTDLNGEFLFESVPSSAKTYEVSYIGYKTVEVAITNNVHVKLKSDTKKLDEVVIVAYGVTSREAQSGSIATVDNEVLKDIPATSVDKMLSGKMAGVQVTASSGQPGASSEIRIRGTSSINAKNDPLWIVDGIPVMTGDQSYFTNSGNAISALNSSDIESLTILKDAAATSVYGSRAANGVILVTTKSGSLGKSSFNAKARYGVSWLANDNNFGVMNGEQLLSWQRDAAKNAGHDPDDPSSTYYRPLSLLDKEQTNWIDYFTRFGKMQDYEVSASAGNTKGRYYTSLAYHKNEGVFYGIDFSKFTARLNADYSLNDKLDIGSRINLAYTESNDVPMQSLFYSNPAFAGLTILPWTAKYDENGNHNLDIPENSNINPRFTAENNDQFEKQYRLNASVYLQYKPISKITLKTTNAAEGTFGKGRRYWGPNPGGLTGTLQTSNVEYIKLTTSNTAQYYDEFADVHSLRVLVGQEADIQTYEYLYGYSPNVDANIPYPNTGTASTDELKYGEWTKSLLSFFGVVDYSFKSKYYLTASLRSDGSSLFGANDQWGVFWALGASWNIKKESFLQNIDFLDIAKLRMSYGINGNNTIDAYKAYGVYKSSAYNGVTGMEPSTPSNSNLAWEKSKTWNVGLDFGFFDNINGSIDVYNKKTEDMLLDKNVPQTSGFGTNFMNVGSVKNSGVEFQINADIISKGDFRWNAGFNVAYNKTEILNLGDVDELTYVSDSRLKHTVGKSFFTYYLKDYYGVDPQNGDALWRAVDPSNPNDESKYVLTNDYNDARYIYAGSPEPDFIGGFNTSLSWKGLRLSTSLEFKQGNEVLIIENRYINSDGNRMTMNQSIHAANYWKKPGDVGVAPKPIAGTASNSYDFASTRWMQDGSFLRIKDVTLSYDVPMNLLSKVNIKGATASISAYNLYTFHNVDFWDPERGVTGMGAGIYPMTKTFQVGLELKF